MQPHAMVFCRFDRWSLRTDWRLHQFTLARGSVNVRAKLCSRCLCKHPADRHGCSPKTEDINKALTAALFRFLSPELCTLQGRKLWLLSP